MFDEQIFVIVKDNQLVKANGWSQNINKKKKEKKNNEDNHWIGWLDLLALDQFELNKR